MPPEAGAASAVTGAGGQDAGPAVGPEEGPAQARKQRPDPMQLFREHILAGKKVSWVEEHVVFEGDVKFHRSSRCGYRPSPEEPPIDIGSLWYMLRQTSND